MIQADLTLCALDICIKRPSFGAEDMSFTRVFHAGQLRGELLNLVDYR
jgi:hypothetical protein